MSLRFYVPVALLFTFAFAFGGGCSSSSGGGSGGGSGSSSGGGSGVSSSGASSSGGGSESGSSSSSSSSSGGLMPGECRLQSDCKAGEFCNLIILPPFCGGQCDDSVANDCQMDSDCADAGVDLICDRPCRCWHGGAVPGLHCTTGCSADADCGPSSACGATHRCEPKACAQAADCTGNFQCTADPAGKHCTPKVCKLDADCADLCVNGACSPTLGTCEPAVP